MDDLLRYTLRINRNLFGKFRYVAEYERRSTNKEMEQLMKRYVQNFEKKHGEIVLTEQKK